MSVGSDQYEPDSAKEIRIALVLNGGVSLAVWMGGVVHELNRMRMASNPGTGDESSAWRHLLTGQLNRRIHIDLIAGTSAGGLNGAVLATSIARGAPMPNMRNIWRKTTSLDPGALTRTNVTSAESALDDDYLTFKICEILDEEIGHGNPMREKDCTLLTTATALNADQKVTATGAGRSMTSTDGRRVYKFARPPVGDNSSGASPFDWAHRDHLVVDWFKQPNRADPMPSLSPLATAMRATASFPGAFEPVLESDGLKQLRVGDPTAPRRWLVDGGVLDNAPFEPLLTALTERPITHFQKRLLLYVTPGVDTLEPWPQGPGDQPNLVSTMAGVLSAMREPDQRLDRDRLGKVFEAMNLSRSQPHTVIRNVLISNVASVESLKAFAAVGDSLFAQYMVSRYEALERVLTEKLAPNSPAPLTNAGPVTIDGSQFGGMPQAFPDEEFTSDISWHWTWGVPTADRVLRWLGRAVSEEGYEADEPGNLVGLRDAIVKAQQKVSALASARDAALRDTPASTVDGLVDILRAFYSVQQDALTLAMDNVVDKFKDVAGTNERSVYRFLLGLEVAYCCLNWSGETYDTPSFTYLNLTPAIEPPESLELELGSNAAQWPQKKLFGEQWGHFGAFAWPQGRDHDWMWGRLDCIQMLTSYLAEFGFSLQVIRDIQYDLVKEILEEELFSLPSESATDEPEDTAPVDDQIAASSRSLPLAGAERVKGRAEFIMQMTPTQLLALMWFHGNPGNTGRTAKLLIDVGAEIIREYLPENAVGAVSAGAPRPKWWTRAGIKQRFRAKFASTIETRVKEKLFNRLQAAASAGDAELLASGTWNASDWEELPRTEGL